MENLAIMLVRNCDFTFLPFPMSVNFKSGLSRNLLGLGLLVGLNPLWTASLVKALPPPDDIPEEILRTEIITEARSPVDGESLTPAEYAELREKLREELPPNIANSIESQFLLLRLRKAFTTIIPFF